MYEPGSKPITEGLAQPISVENEPNSGLGFGLVFYGVASKGEALLPSDALTGDIAKGVLTPAYLPKGVLTAETFTPASGSFTKMFESLGDIRPSRFEYLVDEETGEILWSEDGVHELIAEVYDESQDLGVFRPVKIEKNKYK